jgi:hypothetical protein
VFDWRDPGRDQLVRLPSTSVELRSTGSRKPRSHPLSTLKQYTPECRLEAAIFISALCNASVQTLQMFISCRGLRVLVELLDEDCKSPSRTQRPQLRALNPSISSLYRLDKRDKELVIAALGGIGSVFQLQTSTPRNDFCRMFVREGLEDPLSTALANITQDKEEGAEEAKEQILAVFLLFCQISQSDKRVRDALGKRRILKRTIPSTHLYNRL